MAPNAPWAIILGDFFIKGLILGFSIQNTVILVIDLSVEYLCATYSSTKKILTNERINKHYGSQYLPGVRGGRVIFFLRRSLFRAKQL